MAIEGPQSTVKMEAETQPSTPLDTEPNTQYEDGPSGAEIKEAIFSHQIKREDGIELFDPESAKRDNVDPRIIEVGTTYNQMILEHKGLTEPGMVQEIVPGEDYGNWCGPTNSGPGEPVNSLERACMGHDHCLNTGQNACDCDAEFTANLKGLRDEYPWESKATERRYLEAAIVAVPIYHFCPPKLFN